MTVVDWAQVIGVSLAVVIALIGSGRWIMNWRQDRYDERILDAIRIQWNNGNGNGLEPEIGSPQHRAAERLVTKGRLTRIGNVYIEPMILRPPNTQ